MLEMRTSERNSLKRCAQQWYWSSVEGLAPKRVATPLWFGSLVHDALAQWYGIGTTRGEHPAVYFDRALGDDDRQAAIFDPEDAEAAAEYVSARALGIDMLNRYVEHFGRDENWDVIATEEKFQVWIPRPAITLFGIKFLKVPRWLRYVGTWDGVYRDLSTGEIWLMEHKTAAGIRIDHLPLDDQAGSYWAFATIVLRKRGILGPNEEIAGIMYNFLRKAMADPRPVNAEGLRTNKPNKQHYLDALEPFYELTGKETIATLEELVDDINAQHDGDGTWDKALIVLGDVSKTQPPKFFERWPVYRSRGERAKMVRRIQDEAIFAEAYRKGDLPITKTTSKDCSWCPFLRMCQLDEQGDDAAVAEFKENQFIVRNNYADHEKKSAE